MEKVYFVTEEQLTQIAQAIRDKAGTSDKLSFPGGYVDLIKSIATGVDTSDATITEEDITANKIGYGKDGRIMGVVMKGIVRTYGGTLLRNLSLNRLNNQMPAKVWGFTDDLDAEDIDILSGKKAICNNGVVTGKFISDKIVTQQENPVPAEVAEYAGGKRLRITDNLNANASHIMSGEKAVTDMGVVTGTLEVSACYVDSSLSNFIYGSYEVPLSKTGDVMFNGYVTTSSGTTYVVSENVVRDMKGGDMGVFQFDITNEEESGGFAHYKVSGSFNATAGNAYDLEDSTCTLRGCFFVI